MSESFSNPYNPEVIDIYTEFNSPTGKKYNGIGYYEEYSLSTTIPKGTSYPIETLTIRNTFDWSVRFTPNETGTWA